MGKNNNYWKERFVQIQESQIIESQKYYAEVEKQYRKALLSIERDINYWYFRFASNNQISFLEAKTLLNSKELEELRWNVEEYIYYGKKNALNELWIEQLENASAKFHITRLELLKIQVQQSLEVLFGNQIDQLDDLAKKVYSKGYYQTIYEVQKGFNIGFSIASIDQRRIEKIISKPWALDGKNFSSRIWGNKSNLINEIHNELTQMTILGKSSDNAIKRIAKKMETSRKNAGRLIMTESAYFASESQKDAFKELDVEKYEIVATLDNITSELCQELDGKGRSPEEPFFYMNEWEIGTTAPPFHPWCRTVTAPYFEDNLGKRSARDAEGKVYYISSKIKYKDWKKQFVEKANEED